MAGIVQFENVGLRYGTGAETLSDLSFSLAQGSFYFLTGPSGAGPWHSLQMAFMVCSLRRWSPVAGSWFVVCSGAGRHAGVIGRERNRTARAGKMFFSGQKKGTAPAKPAPGLPAARKKILTGRSERSERPVALPTAPAKLTSRDTPRTPPPGTCRGSKGWT